MTECWRPVWICKQWQGGGGGGGGGGYDRVLEASVDLYISKR